MNRVIALSGGEFLVELERTMAQGAFTELQAVPGGYSVHHVGEPRQKAAFALFTSSVAEARSLDIPEFHIRDLVETFLPVRRLELHQIDKFTSGIEQQVYPAPDPIYATLEARALNEILQRRRRNEDVFSSPISLTLLSHLPGIRRTWGYRKLCTLPPPICKKVNSVYQYITPNILGGAQLLALYVNAALFELSCWLENRGPYPEFYEFIEKVEAAPRTLNKKYRAALSYYVKAFGIAAKVVRVCRYAENPEELNSKEATYQGIEYIENPFSDEVMRSDIPKILTEHLSNYGSRFLKVEHLQEEMTDEWIVRLTQILAFQGLIGYGRSLAPAQDDRELATSEFQRLRSLTEEDRSIVTRFNTVYAHYWDSLIQDAQAAGSLSPSPQLFPYILKEFAKSTAAGLTQKIYIRVRGKEPNERGDRRILRKKSGLFLFHPDPLNMSLEGARYRLGSRDVPVKNTRLVYSIPFPVISAQAKMLGLLNRYVTRGGKGTSPLQPFNVSKIIVGDLEATGCRVLDHGDVLRNSSKELKTLCLDYSDYDASLGPILFRAGFFQALERAGFKREQIEEAFGLTRVVGSRWERRDEYTLQGGVIMERTDPLFKVTHLSGELTTLIANSVFNAAAGCVIRESLAGCLSEQYVGDDSMLIFSKKARINDLLRTPVKVASALGLEVSPSKTTAFPFSIEKTQTHAKFGWYIPQDRIQILETEKPFSRTGAHSEWMAYHSKMMTKATRGFSCALGHALTYLYYLEGCLVNGFVLHRPLLIPQYKGGFGFRRGYLDIGAPIVTGTSHHIKVKYNTWANVTLEPIKEKKFVIPESPILQKMFTRKQLDDCSREVETLLLQALYAENALRPRYKFKDFIKQHPPYRGPGSSSNLYGPAADLQGPFFAFSRDIHPPLKALGKVEHRIAVSSRDDIERIIGQDPKARILLHSGNIFKVERAADFFFYPQLYQQILTKSQNKSIDIKNLGIYTNEFTAMLDFGLSGEQTYLEREIARATALQNWPTKLQTR